VADWHNSKIFKDDFENEFTVNRTQHLNCLLKNPFFNGIPDYEAKATFCELLLCLTLVTKK